MIDPRAPDYSNTPADDRRSLFEYQLREMSSPAVSVVTPFYNTGELFHETACSLFRQSFQNWEWIVVNDGSTAADALMVLDEYRNKDARIRVRDQPNGGPGRARNAGVSAARADYIVFLDSDDLLEPTAIEKWLWHLESRPSVGFVKSYDVGFGAERYLWNLGFHSGSRFLQTNSEQTNCMVRRALHVDVGGFDEENREGLEDWDYWLKMAHHRYWGDSIPEYLTWYRRTKDHQQRWSNWKNMEAYRAVLRKRYPELWEGAFPAPAPVRRAYREPLFSSFPHENPLNKTKKRLLLIVPHLEMGGADKFTLDLMGLLIRDHGYEISVVTTLNAAAPWGHLFTALTPDVFVLENFLALGQYEAFLSYLIASRAPDIACVTQSALGYQLLPALRAKFPDLTVVDYIHMEEEYWKSGGYPRFSVDYQDWLDRTVVSSRHLKEWMVHRGKREECVAVCHTNIDPERWTRTSVDAKAVRARWGLEHSDPIILFAGRICEQKNPKVLGEVLCRLERAGCRFQALIAGEGEDLPWLADYLGRMSVRQTRLLGAVPLEAIRDLLAVSDIFLLPSQMEGIALTLFEAMAMEVVPVSAAVGGQAELVTPECGYLYDGQGDEVSGYVVALKRLLEDPARRAAMARVGRERIEQHFTLDQMGRMMSATFDEVISLTKQEEPAPRSVSPDLWGLEMVEQTQREREFDAFWVLLKAERFERREQETRLATELAAIRNSLTYRMARGLVLRSVCFLRRWVPGFGRLPAISSKRIRLTVLAARHADAKGGEVWLAGLRHDGSRIFTLGAWRPRAKRTVRATGHLYCPDVWVGDRPGMRVRAAAFGEEVALAFRVHPGGGQVRIEIDEHITVLDLYGAESEDGYYPFTWNGGTWAQGAQILPPPEP